MSSHSNKIRVIFSVTNCICFDQRVQKMAETICRLNYDITIVGRKRGQCCNSDNVPFKTRRFRMIIKKGFLFYKFYNIRLFFYLLFHNSDLLVANDLDTLLPNFLVSRLKRLPLVYDSHEYFTGVPEIQNKPFVKFVWKSIEKIIFPRLKYIITVSESIAGLYDEMYHVKPLVVRNFSKTSDLIVPYTRKELGVETDDLLLIIQGAGINIDKGAEELIDAVNISGEVTLLVVGSGDVMPKLKEKVAQLGLGTKVIFIPAVNWETLMKYTKSADIGMCLEKDTNPNYRYSLPNKLFDYISAGLPVIASKLPETEKILNKYGFGKIIQNVTHEDISKMLIRFKNNRLELDDLRRKAVVASEMINWEIESLKVIELYKKIKEDYSLNEIIEDKTLICGELFF